MFRRLIDAMSIWKKNSTKFPPRACDLPSHGCLTRLIAPGVNFCGVDLKSNQRKVGYPHNSYDTRTFTPLPLRLIIEEEKKIV